jgi:hypothetical protein
MHCQQGGEVWAWNGLLYAFRRFQVVSSHFWALVCTGLTGWGHRLDRSQCWPCSHVAHRSDRWCWPVWSVRAELLQLPVSSGVSHAFVQGELHWFRGELFVVFRALVWWFVLFAWAYFCLGCVQPLPLPKGSETCLLQVIFLFAFFGFRSLIRVSFYSFLFVFFCLLLLYVGVVNALIKGEIEDHVWF